MAAEAKNLPLNVACCMLHVAPKVWHGGTYVSLGFAFGGRLKGGYPLAEASAAVVERLSTRVPVNGGTDMINIYIYNVYI